MDYRRKYHKYKADYLDIKSKMPQKQKGFGFNDNIEIDKANIINIDYEHDKPLLFTPEHFEFMKNMPSYVFQVTVDDPSSVEREQFSKEIILEKESEYDDVSKEIEEFVDTKLNPGDRTKVTIKNIWIPIVKDHIRLRNFLTKTIQEKRDIIRSEVHGMAPMTHVFLRTVPKIPEFASLHHYIWMMDPETGEYITFGLNGLDSEVNAWKAFLEEDSINPPRKDNWEKMTGGLFVQFPDFAVNICSNAIRECYGRDKMIEGDDNNTYAIGTFVKKFNITINQEKWLNQVAENLFWLAIGGDINEIDNIEQNENYPIIVLASNINERSFNPVIHLVPELMRDFWTKICTRGETPGSINCRSFADEFARGVILG